MSINEAVCAAGITRGRHRLERGNDVTYLQWAGLGHGNDLLIVGWTGAWQ